MRIYSLSFFQEALRLEELSMMVEVLNYQSEERDIRLISPGWGIFTKKDQLLRIPRFNESSQPGDRS